MLVVVAKLTVKPNQKQQLIGLAKDLIAATQKEEGCISYTLLEDPYNEGVCVFVEEWADKQALETHFTSAHMKRWRQDSADLLAGKTSIKLYQAEEIQL